MTMSAATAEATHSTRASPRPHHARADALAWLVAALCALAALVVLYPGQYPWDSAFQIWQARTGRFSNGSPVAMTALWSLLLDLTGNPATLLAVNFVAFYSGLALAAIAIGERTWINATVIVVAGLSPLALVQMAHLLTDAHLAAVMTLATGLGARGMNAQRRAPLAASLALLVYAGATRYNALVAIVPFAVLIAPAIAPAARRGIASIVCVVALALASLVVSFTFDRALVRERISVWPVIALWDLAAISVDRGVLLLPSFTRGPGMTVQELVVTGAFNPTANTYLFMRSHSGMRDGFTYPYSADERRVLAVAWLDAIRDHPIAYARHRLRTFWLLVGPHDGDVRGATFFRSRTAYRDNPPLPSPWAPRLQDAFYAAAMVLERTWLFAGLPYLLLASVALCIGWVRREHQNARLAMAIAASALLYALTLLPLAPAADLRYLTWPIVAAPLSFAFALSRRRPIPQRGAPRPSR